MLKWYRKKRKLHHRRKWLNIRNVVVGTIYIWTMNINLGGSVAEELTRVAGVLAGFDSPWSQPWVFHVFICSFLLSCNSTGTQRLKQWDLNVVGLIISSQSLAYTLSKFGCGILGDFVSPRILLCVGLACTGLTAIIFTGLYFFITSAMICSKYHPCINKGFI